ncbi:MAG: nucleotide exchange factor GrpE [Nocardioidaceae bacterium]
MTFDPEEFGPDGPVVRDKRRVDPETGEVREPEQEQSAAPGPGVDESVAAGVQGQPGADQPAVSPGSDVETALVERTKDLQRLQAEYVNYKKRVDRDRELVKETAVASTLTSLLPVLDDIGRAREHGELSGGFKAVAESFERIVAGLGLAPFGEVGDEFDPRIHEAMMHAYSDDVAGPVCQAVLQVGYHYQDRVIRPARVAVAEPETPPTPAAEGAEPADNLSEPAVSSYAESDNDGNVSTDAPDDTGTGATDGDRDEQ